MCYLQNIPSSFFLLTASFCLFPILSCVQTPTHTHSCVSCPRPTRYAVNMLFLSFAWWKSRIFHAPAQFFTPNLHFPVTSLIYNVFFLHAFLPFLLSWTHSVAPFPTCVCCPDQFQPLLPGKRGGVMGTAWGSPPASPRSLANILHWSWGWV